MAIFRFSLSAAKIIFFIESGGLIKNVSYRLFITKIIDHGGSYVSECSIHKAFTIPHRSIFISCSIGFYIHFKLSHWAKGCRWIYPGNHESLLKTLKSWNVPICWTEGLVRCYVLHCNTSDLFSSFIICRHLIKNDPGIVFKDSGWLMCIIFLDNVPSTSLVLSSTLAIFIPRLLTKIKWPSSLLWWDWY